MSSTCQDPHAARHCADCRHLPENATTTKPAAPLWPQLRTDGRCMDWMARKPGQGA